ncbi:MAG: YdhR family protein [Neomegalonema sp.]|nr:YdhR family protein [Neomegalonema sp.]
MKRESTSNTKPPSGGWSRRSVLASGTATAGLAALTQFTGALAKPTTTGKETAVQPKAFVYTEVQISVPFADAPWRDISEKIRKQPGFLNKTWLSGLGNNSLGGFYAFDSIENALRFVTVYFPTEPRAFGTAHNTRVFDAEVVAEASLDLSSPHFGAKPGRAPGAFVYTEVQVSVPFDKAPWRDRNPVLRKTPGLIAKTWLSGLNTNTIGGIDAFDTVENARAFAVDAFPETAARMNAAFYTRLFDASVTEEASKLLNSPYYA